MAWDNNFIDELKMQVNIVDVVGQVVELKKAGANYKGLCPFHSEKTPSFMVNEEKQIFNCFGCGEKGDVIKFVESYNKIPFMEAVESLCEQYGIKMPERSSNKPNIDYEKYYAINAKAARFFYNCLGIKGNKGIEYLRSRGLLKETITKWGLGYAPDSWNMLTDYLKSENVSEEDMVKLGLASYGKEGIYDKFRNRVIFPIINTQGKVIGFGGRAIEDIKPKYLNSAESDIFLKKNNLFGLNLCKKEISNQDRVIIVEGYMDVISLYQAGIENAVASLGTALTDNQAKLITRYTKNVVLSYDSDNAGISAAIRGIDVMHKAGAKVKVLSVVDGKDPDEFVKKFGKESFINLVDEAIPATEFKLKIARNGFNLDKDMDVLDYIDRIVPILKELGPVEQDIYFKKLANEFNISEHSIALAVRSENIEKKIVNNNFIKKTRSQEDVDRDLKLELSFLILAMRNYRYINALKNDSIQFRTSLAKKIMSVLDSISLDSDIRNNGIDEKTIFKALDPDEEKSFVKYVNSIQIGADDEAYYDEIKSSYIVNRLKDERVELLNDLAVAEKLERPDEMEQIAGRIIEIDKLIKENMEGKNA